MRRARRGGDYRVLILGESLEAQSLKDILKKAILRADSIKPGFIERLAAHRTTRGRRIVARKPDEIYPGNPQLVVNCAEKLDQKWWYDTNVSYPQCQKYLRVLGQIGGFPERGSNGDRGAMRRDETIAKLQAYAPAIASQGATALFIYGSTARDEAGSESDLDLFIDYDPVGRFNAFDLVGLKLFIEEHLGIPVDLTTRDGLHPALRSRIEESAVRVF